MLEALQTSDNGYNEGNNNRKSPGATYSPVDSVIKTIFLQGVETENCPGFSNALKHGGPIYTPSSPSLADGLAVPVVGYNAYATASPLIDKMVVINEEWIAPAMLHLVEIEKCVVEGAGMFNY